MNHWNYQATKSKDDAYESIKYEMNDIMHQYQQGQLEEKNAIEKTIKLIRNIIEQKYPELKAKIISEHIKNCTMYKNHFFKAFNLYEEAILQTIVPCGAICKINDQIFFSITDAANYLHISKQAVSKAKIKNASIVGGQEIIWY